MELFKQSFYLNKKNYTQFIKDFNNLLDLEEGEFDEGMIEDIKRYKEKLKN